VTSDARNGARFWSVSTEVYKGRVISRCCHDFLSLVNGEESTLPASGFELPKTRPRRFIGERRSLSRKAAGFLRLEGASEGGPSREGGREGFYHIQAVDSVTHSGGGGPQRDLEAYLEPVLEHMLHQFPFRILGFQYDNARNYQQHVPGCRLNCATNRPRAGLGKAATRPVETRTAPSYANNRTDTIDAGHADTSQLLRGI